MVKEKRKARAYKIADKPYEKAMKRAGKEKESLATKVEDWVKEYANGSFFVGIEMMLSMFETGCGGKLEVIRGKSCVIIRSKNPKQGSPDWRDVFLFQINADGYDK